MAKKYYRVTLTATAYASSSVIVEVNDEETDEDGQLLDEVWIEDQAIQQALDGDVDWEYDSVDDDTIQLGTITRTYHI